MSTTALSVQHPLERYMLEVNRYPVLDRDEEQLLARRFRKGGDLEAARLLVLSNLRFVVRIANEYRSYGLPILDLIQEGNVGLMKAVKRFDPERGYRLISYAVHWIRATIQAFILRSWSLVKIGTTQLQKKLFYRLRREQEQLLRDGEGDYDPGELADRLGASEEAVAQMEVRLSRRDFSLDMALEPGESDSATYLDRVEDQGPLQDQQVAEAEVRHLLGSRVESALTRLNERERLVVQERLMADEPLTLQELGDRFGVTRERARQIEAAAKKKLRAALGEEVRLLTA